MRIIEIYSENLIDNIYASLRYHPQEVLFLFFDDKKPGKYNDLKYYLEDKLHVDITDQMLNISDETELNLFLHHLTSNDLVDLTGGNDLVKFLFTCKIDNYNYNCIVADFSIYKEIYYDANQRHYTLTDIDTSVNFIDFIRVNGSRIISCESKAGVYNSSLVNELFQMVVMDKEGWKDFTNAFQSLVPRDKFDKHQKLYAFPKPFIDTHQKFIKLLLKYNIFQYDLNHNICVDSSSNKLDLLLKNGSVLELFIYYLLKNTTECDYIESGVVIKWDGDDKKDSTRNEIDVIAQFNRNIHFISCKLSNVDTSTINEIYMLVKQFTFGYGKMHIIAMNEFSQGVIDRAEEIGCNLIDVRNKTKKQILTMLKGG